VSKLVITPANVTCGYKRYLMGQVETNISADEVNHVKHVILCNRVSLHWSPTRAINNHNV
jgi:hypothetical protein